MRAVFVSEVKEGTLVRRFVVWIRRGGFAAMALALPLIAVAQTAPKPLSDGELKSYISSLQARIDDPTVEVVIRERLALDLASTLDRAAQAAEDTETRRSLWNDAVETLDRFREAHREQTLSRSFEVQAAVYLWARARMEMSVFQSNPAAKDAKTRAISDLELSISRLKGVSKGDGPSEDIVSKNARFRLAQALTDLADLTGDDPKLREDRYKEALAALLPPINEPSLVSFNMLLKASLLTKLKRQGEAGAVLDEVAKLKSPAPPLPLLEGKIEWLSADQKFDEAAKLIDGTKGIDDWLKASLKSKVLLNHWLILKVDDARRSAIETQLFEELALLKKAKRPAFRSVVLDVFKTIKEPDPKQDGRAWDMLADGAVASRELASAGDLERKGAVRAQEQGKKDVVNELRLKSGAYFYQAGRQADVETSVGPILADKDAGPDRVKASLLIALALGRAASDAGRTSIKSQYAAALKNHLGLFPSDPSVPEVQWLLGKFKVENGDRAGATKLWTSITHGQSRWLESQIELSRLRRLDLEQQRLNGDRVAIDRLFKNALEFLEGCLKQAKGEAETIPLRIEIARLELTPSIGTPSEAQKQLDTVLRSVATESQRTEARWLRLVALAQLSRFVEAEQFVRREVKDVDPFLLFEPIRLLDRTAAESESDLRSRRIGFLMSILLDRARTFQDIYNPEQLGEISLRYARALAFTGSEAAAKRALAVGRPLPRPANPDLLRDLAELYASLDTYAMAEDVQRLRTKQLTPGSIPWFDATYGLALSYYHQGKGKEALHLIDATSILHPELGGSELKTKFIRLRQRLEPPSGTP